MNINQDVLRVIKPYIDKAIADALTGATGSGGAITKAIDDAIKAHAALSTGTTAGTVHPGASS